MLSVALDIKSSFILIRSKGRFEVAAKQGWTSAGKQQLDNAVNWIVPFMNQTLVARGSLHLSPEDILYQQIPLELVNRKGDGYIFNALNLSGGEGILVCRLDFGNASSLSESEINRRSGADEALFSFLCRTIKIDFGFYR
jgi:hypothetical protein